MIDVHKLRNGEALCAERFAKPSREFGIMPFWFWNGGMDYAEMEYQLREYRDKGIPGLFIHARFGVREQMEYLGREWFERVRFTIDKAHELGLQVWVYDEYNWPSGTAGQTIQKDEPGLTGAYLQLVEGDLPGQFFTFMEGTDSRYNDLERSEPVYACAVKLEDIEAGRFEYVDLMPSLSFEKVITWEAPLGPWKLFYFIERKTDWYTDVLNPETTRRFLDVTHERYKAAQGGSFCGGKGTQGFYTDEPAMLYFEAGRDNFVVPWTKNMFKIFRERNGYDLRHKLPLLYYDIGPESEKLRYDFWSTLSSRYDDAYYRQIADWCNQNNTLFTGHLLHEESLRMHAKSGGNLFHHLRHFHITGVDHLYPRVGTREMPGEHVALKLASSAAHQFGSTRLLCESMGGAYWDCTMERMKWIADWEYMLGVNIFNPHGFHYSIEGERKRDWPPSQFYHHTWWKHYGLFNSYLSRLGYILTGGRHAAKIAILYPMASVWANFRPQYRDPVSALIEEDFVWLTDRLLRLHIDFDYIDEDSLHECEIKDGKLCLGGEEYELLLLPPCTHIKSATAKVMEDFKTAGGRLIGGALLPRRFVDAWDERPEERIRALFDGGKALRREGKGFAEEDDTAALGEMVFGLIEPSIEIDSREVFSLHRVKDGKHFFFIINPTGGEQTLRVKLHKVYAPELWDAENGRITPLVHRTRDSVTELKLRLAPFGSALIGAEEKYRDCKSVLVPLMRKSELEPITLDGEWLFETDKPNALILSRWKCRVGACGVPVLTHLPQGGEWLDFTMGAWEMQLPVERDECLYPEELWFAASFAASFVPGDLGLLADGFKCSSYELYVNGRQVTEKPVRSYLDAEIGFLPLASYARTGENIIMLRMSVNSKTEGLLDLLKLTGSFSVETRDSAEIIAAQRKTIQSGDWVGQGFPYFAGTGTYAKTFTLPPEYAGRDILLETDVGTDVLECDVNGQAAGVCLWKPYSLNITEFLRPGENKLCLRVTNTIASLLEATRQASGLFSARLRAYDRYESSWEASELED